mmetsp:Transcript_7946/g.18145  ORF Transcript_7946/g.18145 Transcript_7946/m.18145 type:complete len:315 (-) Transcript_7946:227-1171(-)
MFLDASLDLLDKFELDFGRAKHSPKPEERSRCGALKDKSAKRQPSYHKLQFFSRTLVPTRLKHELRESEPNGASQPGPDHEGGILGAGSLAESAEKGIRHEKHQTPDRSHDEEEEQHVAVVACVERNLCGFALVVVVHHRPARDDAREEEEHRVPEVLDRVPNNLERLAAVHQRPGLVGKHQSRAHATQDARHRALGFADEKRQVRRKYCDAGLNDHVRCRVFSIGDGHPNEGAVTEGHAKKRPRDRHSAKEQNNCPVVLIQLLIDAVVHGPEEHEEDYGHPVVEERLARDLHRELGRRANLLEHRNHCHRVRG